jgi:hypothetical protein
MENNGKIWFTTKDTEIDTRNIGIILVILCTKGNSQSP